MSEHFDTPVSELIIDHLWVGIFAVSSEMKILRWNRFMESHSGFEAPQVLGRNLFEVFPELPRRWLEKKIDSVFVLKNFGFTSWQERPYLFRFSHGRPITGGIDLMQQNCTLMPLKGVNGQVDAVCVALFDVTDIALVQRRLEEALATVAENASRDGLTGVYNRRYLEQRLAEEFARHKRHRRDLAVLLLDIDHFKRVNDGHGHPAGDAVLRIAAKRVAALVRETDVFCRYGGEEFIVVLPETGLTSAMLVAEKLRKAVGDGAFDLDTQQLFVTVSIGAAAARPEVLSYEQLIKEADTALYAAKAQGRNRSVAFASAA